MLLSGGLKLKVGSLLLLLMLLVKELEKEVVEKEELEKDIVGDRQAARPCM